VNPPLPHPQPGYIAITEEARLYITEEIEPAQRHGLVQPTLGWLSMGPGVHNMFPEHQANVPASIQGDGTSRVHVAPRDSHLQPLSDNPQ
jgi:hypothetical protein